MHSRQLSTYTETLASAVIASSEYAACIAKLDYLRREYRTKLVCCNVVRDKCWPEYINTLIRKCEDQIAESAEVFFGEGIISADETLARIARDCERFLAKLVSTRRCSKRITVKQ